MSATASTAARRWPRSAIIAAILATIALAFVVIVVIFGYGRGGNREPLLSPRSHLSSEDRVEFGPSPRAPAVQGVGRYIVRREDYVTLDYDGQTWIRIGPHRQGRTVVGDLYATRENPDLRLIELRETPDSKPRYRLERYDEQLEWVAVD